MDRLLDQNLRTLPEDAFECPSCEAEIVAGVEEGDVLVIPSAEDLSFPDGGVPGSGRDDDPDGPFGGGGE